MAVLALLARAGQRGISRDKVLALLWPDADADRGSRTLAQALYALRKDLIAEDAITGSRELRFDPALVTTDVGEFAAAVSRGDDARAAELYAGPFLDGFHLAGAEEFARWVDGERATLAQDYSRVLESLARSSFAGGNASAAVSWWRKLAALDPLNARVTVGLMEALAAAGDRPSAIKQARLYELLVEQELELPPDREVLALAERLRVEPVSNVRAFAEARPTVAPSAAASPTVTTGRSDAMVAANVDPAVPPLPMEQPVAAGTGPAAAASTLGTSTHRIAPERNRVWWMVGGALAAMAGAAWLLAARDGSAVQRFGSRDQSPVVAIGRIASYGTDSSASAMAGPASDLLATSLARSPGLRVVSSARMMELMRRLRQPGDTSGAELVAAAREAGATEIIDGTLYARPSGALRLDLRRVDIATGAIGDVRTIEGNDLFALVDSGTAHLIAALGSGPPAGSVADVTTRSVVAYRMYEEGIDAFFRGDRASARRLFDGALAEDSMFALAAYYGTLASESFGPDSYLPRMQRAQRLAARAPDRERLTILADWANRASLPTLRQVAETLATRYPTEVEGHLYRGIALVNEGDFLAARAPLDRVIAMDSLGTGRGVTCGVCIASRWLVSAYLLADSLPAAERTARRWLHLQPNSPESIDALVAVLDHAERSAEADSVANVMRANQNYDDAVDNRAFRLIRAGAYDVADRLLAGQIDGGTSRGRTDGYWALAISLREQGRLDEALDAMRRLRRVARATWPEGPVSSVSVLEAQVQLERGQPVIAAALFDSVVRARPSLIMPSQLARDSAWRLTHVANARAAAGDTAALAPLADLVQSLGARSGYGRDRRLHHHIRGLLLVARGDDAAAINEFRQAIYSLTGGYTRTNLELADAYLRMRRPLDAIAVLQPALRGSIEAQNLFVNRIEIHDRLAQAWQRAGRADSAAAHYRVVARAWAAGDPAFRVRADSARVRAGRR
jgi:DNA-binding SARP family transcriptional activator/tetratricopeptide (TPR) repeat protein